MSWEFKKLGEVTELQGGSQPPKSTFKYEEAEGYLRLLQIRDFKSDDRAVFIPKSKKNRLCYENDILIGRYGASVGKICTGKKGAYNVALMKATPDKELLNTRLYLYYLKSKLFQDELASVSSRSAQNGFSKDDIKDFIVPIPPLPVQKQIVETLDKAFEKIDKAIANAEQNLKNIKELFESYLQSVFENKEDEWEEKALGEVCNKIQDGAHHSPKNLYTNREDGLFPYVTSKNVKNNYMDLSKLQFVDEIFHQTIYPRCKPEMGDVLLTKDGAKTGNVTLNTLDEPFSLLSSVCLIKTKKKELRPDFLKYYIQSPIGFKSITGKMTGAAIKRIILRAIKSATIPLPSVGKQKEIVKNIDSLLLEIKKLEAIHTQKIVDLEELKKSILEKAFKGELTSAA